MIKDIIKILASIFPLIFGSDKKKRKKKDEEEKKKVDEALHEHDLDKLRRNVLK